MSCFQQLGTLEHLEMPQNGIVAEGVIALAAAIRANPRLRVLNLSDNTFGRRGAISMAKVRFKNWVFHKLLSIFFNSDVGFNMKILFQLRIFLRQAISHLHALESVDFSDCLCRNRGSVKIAKELVHSRSPLRVWIKIEINVYFIHISSIYTNFKSIDFMLI